MTTSDTPTTEHQDADVLVVGGGPAGLSTALYTTRLGLDTTIINRGGGRAAMMIDTHNVIGVPETVSGNEFLQTATDQLEDYGATVIRGFVDTIEPNNANRQFQAHTTDDTYHADRVVLATGFTDERPDPPLPRTGRGLHYCLHCDAFMFVDQPVYVMGHSNSAAHVAMIMLNFTDEVDLLLRGDEPTWSDDTATQLDHHPIDIIHEDIDSIEKTDDGWLSAFVFTDGTRREYRGGFPMYGSTYHNKLAKELGATLNQDGTVSVDDDGQTTVDGVYAVGDLTPGHNQIPVAMGEGANVGIAIHLDLREFPRPLTELDESTDITPEEVPAISEALRTHAQRHRQSAND